MVKSNPVYLQGREIITKPSKNARLADEKQRAMATQLILTNR